MKNLQKHFGPLMLAHIMKDERIREYRALDDTIEACRENMLVNQWNAELGYYEFPGVTFRDYEN